MIINPWVWLLLAVIFALVETFTMSMITVWFIIGAVIAFTAAWFGAAWEIQMVLFFVSAIVLLIFFRPLAKDYFKIGAVKTGFPALIGQVGVVQEKIVPPHYGAISIQGQVWTAEAVNEEPIDIGEKVKILGIEGVILKVQKLENN